MTVKDDIKTILAGQPGLSAREIADCLARDQRNTRRDISELKGKGELVSRKDEAGIDQYYLADGGLGHDGQPALVSASLPVINTKVIDGVPYKDVTEAAPANSSRALVPAGQPYDSRTALALEQIKRAKRLRSPGGQAMGQSVIAGWNDLFTADPNGLETLAALQRAEFARAEAERIERERARQASAMAQQQAVEPSMWDMGMRAAILGFDAYCSMGRQQAEARAAGRQSSATERAEPYEDYFTRRQRAKREAEELKPPSLLDRLRDRARTGTSPEGEAQPPVSNRPESSWWRKHFGTPRRAVWR